MLERLDAIDWKALRHAYGSAGDVPVLIRALASPDPGERDEAIVSLFGNIHHQGTIYEASAPAVPFLIELLGDDSPADRAGILLLLGELARGTFDLGVSRRHGPEPAAAPDGVEALGRDHSGALDVRKAVEAGLPDYVRLLGVPERSIRPAAAYTLSACAGRADEASRALRSALAAGPDEVEGFGLALLLGNLGREADVPFLRAIPADGPTGWAAAVAMAEILRERTPAGAAARVASAFAAPGPLDDLLGEQPWAPAEAVELAREAIETVDDAEAVPALTMGIGLAEEYHARRLASDLLDRVFPIPAGPPTPPPGPLHRLGWLIGLRGGDPPCRPIDSLDSRQIAALRAIAAAGRVWGSVMDLSADLRRRDLPDVREALLEYLSPR